MRKSILVLVASCACLATPVLARDDGLRARGNSACGGDARRICRSVLGQGDMAVLQCFQSNRSRLSGRCSRFLRQVGQL